MTARATVSFYFDCTCPWSYLACGRLREAALRTGARIRWRPVFSDEVLAAAQPAFPAERRDPHPLKARYQGKDLGDWARYLGLPLPEVAGTLGIAVGTVKSRLHRALEDMRFAMAAQEADAATTRVPEGRPA